MKPRKTQPAKKKAAGGTLVGMFIGLVIGVAIAAGVVFYLNKSPLPFVERAQPPAKADGQAAANGQPLALPGKPGDPVPEKRFQFYDILPGKADAVPDKAPKPEAKKEEPKKEEKKEEPAKESKTPLFLQAGSFSTAQDADNQKAKLAFMGLEAVVQQVMIQDKTFYRVRVGPYTKIDELNKVRAELAKSGIEAQLAK
jgi:cell division protein FtsN